MSMPRGFGLNGQALYTNIAKPVTVNLSFVVAATNGLGVTSLKSNGAVEAVFMHTSVTPTSSAGGVLNPNPPVGYAQIRLKNNFNTFIGANAVASAPTTSNATTSTTANNVYVITSLGTTTAAQWLAAGLPAGFTAAVGAAFVAKATGAIGGTGTVGLPGFQTASLLSVIGAPLATISNNAIRPNSGASLLMQFAGPTSSSVTTLVAANPADGTVVSAQLYFDGSSVTIDGL